MDPFDKNELSQLIIESLEGTITSERLGQLDRLLSQNREAVKDYTHHLTMYSLFIERGGILFGNDKSVEADLSSIELWKDLADYEKNAPAIEILRDKPQQELIQKVIYPPREKHKISKFNIVFFLMNAAAVLFIMLFLKLTPSIRPVEVATLSDSMNARWSNLGTAVQKGARILTGNSISLNKGLVEMLFDNGARVILEAPVDCQILTDDRIRLTYGKLYAVVPQDATGFSVCTPNTKIIDLGTEFGVEIDCNGNTQLSVLKGRTLLLVSEMDKINMEVCEGTAKKICGRTGEISDIRCRTDYFVRGIESKTNITWRGQKTLDLADIVRNGNGMGTGNSQVRLNYIKGFTTDLRGGETLIAKDFLPIKDHPFIDGIFIPNGKTVVNSKGDVFEDIPFTNGVYCADLFGNPVPGSFFLDEQQHTIQFDEQEYSERGKSCIFMPGSNHGITFDLNAIRDCYNLETDRFTSRVGLADFDNKRCNANFYVLVDGQLRYSLLAYNQKGVLNNVSVKLEDTDRFLTLVACENVDQIDYMANSTLRHNWCVFTEPVLVFK